MQANEFHTALLEVRIAELNLRTAEQNRLAAEQNRLAAEQNRLAAAKKNDHLPPETCTFTNTAENRDTFSSTTGQTRYNEFAATQLKFAKFALSSPFQESDPIKYVFEFAKHKSVAGLLATAASNINHKNTKTIKNKLSLDLQSQITTLIGSGPNDYIFGRGPNGRSLSNPIGPVSNPILDPVRPVLILAQIHMIELWADSHGYQGKYKKFADSSTNPELVQINPVVQNNMEFSLKIFTAHKIICEDSAENVFMLLGPSGIGTSFFQSTMVAYITSRKFPITVISSPEYLHTTTVNNFGSWSVDFDQNPTSQAPEIISISTFQGDVSDHGKYINQLESHIKQQLPQRIVLVDPLEAHDSASAVKNYHTMISKVAKQSSASLFLSVHSSTSLLPEQVYDKTEGILMAEIFPNFTFFNMPFTHQTLMSCCDALIKIHKKTHKILKKTTLESSQTTTQPTKPTKTHRVTLSAASSFNLSNLCPQVRNLHVVAAPNFRNYLRFINNNIDAVQCAASGTFTMDTTTRSGSLIYQPNERYLQSAAVPKCIKESIMHDFNPDRTHTEANETYLSPFVRAQGVVNMLNGNLPPNRGSFQEIEAFYYTIQYMLDNNIAPTWTIGNEIVNITQLYDYSDETDPGSFQTIPKVQTVTDKNDTIITLGNKQIDAEFLESLSYLSTMNHTDLAGSFHMLPRHCPAADFALVYLQSNQLKIHFIQIKRNDKPLTSTKFQTLTNTCFLLSEPSKLSYSGLSIYSLTTNRLNVPYITNYDVPLDLLCPNPRLNLAILLAAPLIM